MSSDHGPRLRALESAIRLAKEATNGWACYAKRQVEHDEIARLHRELDALLRASLPPTDAGARVGLLVLSLGDTRRIEEFLSAINALRDDDLRRYEELRKPAASALPEKEQEPGDHHHDARARLVELAGQYLSHEDRAVRDLALFVHGALR